MIYLRNLYTKESLLLIKDLCLVNKINSVSYTYTQSAYIIVIKIRKYVAVESKCNL